MNLSFTWAFVEIEIPNYLQTILNIVSNVLVGIIVECIHFRGIFNVNCKSKVLLAMDMSSVSTHNLELALLYLFL